jgi:hypothetical protein
LVLFLLFGKADQESDNQNKKAPNDEYIIRQVGLEQIKKGPVKEQGP